MTEPMVLTESLNPEKRLMRPIPGHSRTPNQPCTPSPMHMHMACHAARMGGAMTSSPPVLRHECLYVCPGKRVGIHGVHSPDEGLIVSGVLRHLIAL